MQYLWYNAAALLARKQAESQKHTTRIHRSTHSSSNAFQAYRYLRVSARAIFSHSRFSDFFVIIFFFSNRPSTLRNGGKNYFLHQTSSRAMEVCIVTKRSFLSCSTTQRQITVHITERCHFTTATPFRVHPMLV